jgi:hypothetical protein
MDWMFWWMADAESQPEVRGCLGNFAVVILIAAVIAVVAFLMGTWIWG